MKLIQKILSWVIGGKTIGTNERIGGLKKKSKDQSRPGTDNLEVGIVFSINTPTPDSILNSDAYQKLKNDRK